MTNRILTILALTLVSLPSPARGQTPPPPVIEYYHLDAIGSVRAVTNEAGQIVRRHNYAPFGEEHLAQGGNDPLRFTGKERDAETGLDYFGARYYQSRAGRFAAIDPVYTWEDNLADPQRWNRYAYVRNNPQRYVDPDGREIWPAFQSAKPADFQAAAGLLVGLAKSLGNIVIALNSPGHVQPEADTRRYFEPADTAEAVGMAVTNIGLVVAPLAARAGSTIEVVHYTNTAGKASIDASRQLRAGTYVTKPNQVTGLSPSQIESKLEIQPGKGQHSVTVTVKRRDLAVPPDGSRTSGGAWQRQLSKPCAVPGNDCIPPGK